MTFGAMAAWQGWLLLAGATALAVFIFRLKVRPRKVRVPSLLFWGRVLNDARELTLWERIRRAVSLVITAMIAIALGLALLRPSSINASTGFANDLTRWSSRARFGRKAFLSRCRGSYAM